MKFFYLDIPEEKRNACIEITKALPLWFGLETANQQYALDAENFPSIAVKNERGIIGLLVYKEQFDPELSSITINIHWLGILPDFHRMGLGKALIDNIIDVCSKKKINVITVETLDPIKKDEGYLRTFEFYKRLGFEIYSYFDTESINPMIKMKKSL